MACTTFLAQKYTHLTFDLFVNLQRIFGLVIHPGPVCHAQSHRGWSGGAMVLGKLPVPGRPTIWMIVGQGPIALAVGAVGVVWTFLLSSPLSLPFLPLSGRRPDID